MGFRPSALYLLWALWAVGCSSVLVAQVPLADPAKALANVNAHIVKINELGKKLKDCMRAGFPPVKDRNEALQIVEETFCDIVRFKAHYELAHASAKRTENRDDQRMRVRGMKNAYFPGDFFDYLPLIERLQKHVERFHVPVNPLEWYSRYKKAVEADMVLLQREFESDTAAANPPGMPIWEAVEGKLVEAAVAGDDRVTSRVKLLIRNLSGKKLTVNAPPWTAGMPSEEGKQIMLIREPLGITLAPDASETVECACVCADLRIKERPTQKFSVYRFGAYPSVRDLAAIQNIIGIVDLAEVKGQYSSFGIPTAIRPHTITQLCIWRHLARTRNSGPADITKDTARTETPLQLGQHPDQLPPDQAKTLMEHGPEIIKKVDEALQKLDI
ncbi:MAG: hypothetical protein AB1696_21745 [Planctomycetota bacterium]